MRILAVGGTGTVGKAALSDLRKRHDIVTAGRTTGDVTVDVIDESSSEAL